MKRARCARFICALFAAFAATQLSPCQQPATSTGAAPRQQQKARKQSAYEQSCKAFVQKFYDWYWNRFADQEDNPDFDTRKEPDVWTVLKGRPSVLGSELRHLLANEVKQMRATHEIGNLDFDPFLNSQDARGKYFVQSVAVTNGVCRAGLNQRHVVTELKMKDSTWVFWNFRYGFYSDDGKKKESPDDDLIHILSR